MSFSESGVFVPSSHTIGLSTMPQLEGEIMPDSFILSKRQGRDQFLFPKNAVYDNPDRASVAIPTMTSISKQHQFDEPKSCISCDGLVTGQKFQDALTTPDEAHRILRKKRKSPTNKYQWERVRSEITRLYMDENFKLKDVMKILESDFGFKASQRMYKNKFTEWSLQKKVRKKKVKTVSVLKTRPSLGTQSSWPLLQYDHAHSANTNRCQTKNATRSIEMLQKCYSNPAYKGRELVCRTSSPSLTQLQLRDMTAGIEELFNATNTYTDTASEPHRLLQYSWLSANDHDPASTNRAIIEMYNVIDAGEFIARLMRNCILCLDHGRCEEFWLILRKIFLDLEGVILSAHPMAWCRLIWFYDVLVSRGISELASRYWLHVRALVGRIDRNIPHKQVLDRLLAIDVANVSFPAHIYQIIIQNMLEKQDVMQHEVLSIWKATTHDLNVSDLFVPYDEYRRICDFLIQYSRQTYGGRAFALLVAISHLVISEEGLNGGYIMFKEGLHHLTTARNDRDKFYVQTLLFRSGYLIRKAYGYYDDASQELKDYQSNMELMPFKYDMNMEEQSTQTTLRLIDLQWINPSKDYWQHTVA